MTPDSFDAFYAATRRRLLLQAFALTGDLAAARSAVRDTFIAARQHWRKVSRVEDPEDWVRPRAWARAQRRAAGRVWHRERKLTDQQRRVLDGLHKLSDPQRRVLLLTHLSALSLARIGREVGQPPHRTEELLQQASAGLSLSLDCNSALLRTEIESLAPLVARPGLPRATAINRSGVRRRRLHAAGGCLIAVALVVGAGAFVRGQAPATRLSAAPTSPVTPAMLVRPAQAPPIRAERSAGRGSRAPSPAAGWVVADTGHNTSGDGLHTRCQASRFADPRGVTAFVRTLSAPGSTGRELVQTVEVSATPGAAERTYETTLGWYAGCRHARVQLLDAYRLVGVGDRAEGLTLRLPDGRAYVVAVVRTGSVTDTLVLHTRGRVRPQLHDLLGTVVGGVLDLCHADAAGRCRVGPHPHWQHERPPPSGATPGMLATVDLPAVGGITDPWVGTDPVSDGRNPAQTTCDRTDFAPALDWHTRTYLIPQADLPDRFGLTESYGRFADAQRAGAFAARIRKEMASCEHRELGSHLSHHVERRGGPAGSSYALWRVTTELSDGHRVSYWMGVAAAGPYVAQVTFAPTGRNDLDRATFADLVDRARDRLLELPGATTP